MLSWKYHTELVWEANNVHILCLEYHLFSWNKNKLEPTNYIKLVLLFLNTALCLPHITIIRKTDQVRRKLVISSQNKVLYHNPKSLNILPEFASNEKQSTTNREENVREENDLVIVVVRRGEQAGEERHCKFFCFQFLYSEKEELDRNVIRKEERKISRKDGISKIRRVSLFVFSANKGNFSCLINSL